jgi:hypothetical protein
MDQSDNQADSPSHYPLTADNVDIDDEPQERALLKQVLQAGNRFMEARWEELIEKGIIDRRGNLLKHELPSDMAEGSEQDFGG